jgi:hypothetical protein
VSERRHHRRPGALGIAFALLLGAAGCGALAAPTVWTGGNQQPLIAGWQQFFRVQWESTTRNERTSVQGYISNTWGFTAQRIRLLITGYDASGQALGQVIAWGPNEIDPGGRRFFDVPVPPGASTYDVAIFAWDWVQTGGGANIP